MDEALEGARKGAILSPPLQASHQLELTPTTALHQAVVLQQMLKYLGADIEKWWRCNDVRQ